MYILINILNRPLLVEEEQQRDRYMKRIIDRTHSGQTGLGHRHSETGLMPPPSNLTPIISPTSEQSFPVPPPPSPDIPHANLEEISKQRSEQARRSPERSSGGESSDEESDYDERQQKVVPSANKSTNVSRSTISTTQKVTSAKGGRLRVPSSQSSDTLTAEHSGPSSPSALSSATSSATLVGSIDSKFGSPRASPIRKSPPSQLPTSNTSQPTDTTPQTELSEKSQPNHRAAIAPVSSIRKVPPPPPPPSTTAGRTQSLHHNQVQFSAASQLSGPYTPPVASATAQFVLPSRPNSAASVPASQQALGRQSVGRVSSASIGTPTAGMGSSNTLTPSSAHLLRVKGAGGKRGSGTSEYSEATSTGTTPRSSFQTETTGVSTPRSSFQHPDSPQNVSKAGVVITSSRASSRRSSTASAASAFAVATAASSNPPEPLSNPHGTLPSGVSSSVPSQAVSTAQSAAASRASSRLPSAAGSEISRQSVNRLNAASASGAGGKRESMISTAATMRVLNVLRHWVSKHSQDFENDPKLFRLTVEFLEELIHNTTLLPAEHKAATQLLQMINKADREPKVDLDVLLSPPMTASRDTIETLSALEIAEGMTYLDHKIFVAIRSEEFLGQAWMKCEKAMKAPHILLMTKRFNEISCLVSSEILRAPEMARRVTVIEKWAGKCSLCNHSV